MVSSIQQSEVNMFTAADVKKKVEHFTEKECERIDGTTDSKMTFSCVEVTGVKYYSVKVADIPLKYWELDKEDKK